MNHYRDFFVESEEGAKFVQRLYQMIDSEHQHAEDEPELSLEHTQRAKGIRQVLELVQSLSAESKKGRATGPA